MDSCSDLLEQEMTLRSVGGRKPDAETKVKVNRAASSQLDNMLDIICENERANLKCEKQNGG
jgi:hypothetical protein